MVGLSRSELSIGLVYGCLLGGFSVLIIGIDRDPSSISGVNYDIVWGRYFNSVSGKYEKINIVDGQLVSLVEDDDGFDDGFDDDGLL